MIRPAKSSASTLTFTYWFLWCAQTPLIQLFLSDAPRLQTLILLGFGPTFLFLAATTKFSVGGAHRWPKKATWIVVYLTWMGLSLFWTYASNRLFATAVYMGAAAEVAAVVLLCSNKNAFRSALKGILAGAFVTAIVLAVQLCIDPEAVMMAHGITQQETTLNPNCFGYRIALGALGYLFLSLNGKKGVLPRALFLTAALVATTSKNSIALFCLIAPIYLLFSRAGRRVKVAISAALALAACIALPLSLRYFQAYEEQGQVNSLTGRIPLWGSIISLIADRPILGYGFCSVKDIALSSWGAMHAHNDFMQQWVTLGLPGLILAGTLYAVVWRRLRRSPSPFAVLGLLWLIFGIGHGILDSDFIWLGFPLQLVVLFLYPLPANVGAAEQGTKVKRAVCPREQIPRVDAQVNLDG